MLQLLQLRTCKAKHLRPRTRSTAALEPQLQPRRCRTPSGMMAYMKFIWSRKALTLLQRLIQIHPFWVHLFHPHSCIQSSMNSVIGSQWPIHSSVTSPTFFFQPSFTFWSWPSQISRSFLLPFAKRSICNSDLWGSDPLPVSARFKLKP